MKVIWQKIDGLAVIEPRVFIDMRGYFLETFQSERFSKEGLPTTFPQDNHSHSKNGVLRGLHYQYLKPQGLLVYVSTGTIFDVAVDLRKGSSTFGKWESTILSEENHKQVYLPPGLAHGFFVISEHADVHYKCTEFFDQNGEAGILWSDPEIGIDWPESAPKVNDRDSQLPLLKALPDNLFPRI